FRDLRVLRRQVIDEVAGRAAPAIHPEFAKSAVAVINHQRLWRRRSNANGGFHPADIIRNSALHQSETLIADKWIARRKTKKRQRAAAVQDASASHRVREIPPGVGLRPPL